MMKLYGFNTVNSLKVLLMLSETDLPYEFVPVNIRQGDQHLPNFRLLNPAGKVPVFQDGDFTLTESNAILLYLARKTTWGIGDEFGDYDDVVSWLFYQASTQGPYFGQVEYWSAIADEPNSETTRHYRQIADRSVELINKSLLNTGFLAGRKYGVADLAHFVWMRHWEALGLTLENAPNVEKWLEEINSRPATKRSLEFFSSEMFNASPLERDR